MKLQNLKEILIVVDSYGNPYIFMKQIVNFQDVAKIEAKLSSQIETMQAKIDKLEGKPWDNTTMGAFLTYPLISSATSSYAYPSLRY